MKQKTRTARRKARQVAAIRAVVVVAEGPLKLGNQYRFMQFDPLPQAAKQRVVEAYKRLVAKGGQPVERHPRSGITY